MPELVQPVPLPVPPALQPWIAFDVGFEVLLCVRPECRYAVSPSSLSQHLRQKHKANTQLQQEATRYAQQFLTVSSDYDFRTVPLPLGGGLPLPILPVLSGFQCLNCSFTTQSRSGIRKHANQEHNQKGAKDEDICRKVQLQTWFEERRARYWVVDASGESRDVNNRRDSSNGSGSGDVGDIEAAIKAEIKEWIKKEEEEYKVSTVATEIDPWLQYTSWEEVLAGSKHSLVKTAEFTATATADEPELECLLQSWERIVQRSLATLAAVSQYKDILKWWASPKNEAASQKPFELPQNHSKS